MVFNEDGHPRFSHGVMIDITDRRKAEDGLARQMAQLNALYDVSREVVTSYDPETVYLAAHNAAKQTLVRLTKVALLVKRFKLTATGKIKHGVAGKRHRLISHNAKYIRQNRGTEILADADTARVKAWAPYGLK